MRIIKRIFTRRRILTFLGLVSFIWLIVVAVLSVIILTVGADNEAQPADVIIVLGSGLRRDGRPGDALIRRSLHGVDLYEQGFAAAIICTGGRASHDRRSEAEACGEILANHGVPAEAIYLEESARSTEENAINSQIIMEANGWETALLVTDSFHMLRAGWIFDIYNINHLDSPVPRQEVRYYHFTRHFAREIVALHWQLFKDTFNLPFTSVGAL